MAVQAPHLIKRARDLSLPSANLTRRSRPSSAPDLHNPWAAVVHYSNDAIFIRTLNGTITSWNAAAERIFGFAAGEILGRSSRCLLPRGRRDEYQGLLARLRRGEVIEHFETERVRKDGSRIHLSLTLSPIRDRFNRLTGFSTIARDITEQRRVRQALARRELELNDLFEPASVGLVLLTPEGRVQRANQAFLDLLNRPAPQVHGQLLGHFHPDPAVLAELLRQLARRESVQNFATEFQVAHGPTRFVLVDADGLWERGRLVHSRWFVRDISRRRQLERELLEISDREQRAFAQELHDGLGQQLGGIAYLSNVLREQLSERAAEEAGGATRIFELIRKVIEETRRMARGLSPVREEPEGLMDALAELAAQTSELRGIRSKWVCPQPVLVPDPTVASHLHRIAQEAVNNAVRHGRPRHITLTLCQNAEGLKLSIVDDGRGLGPLSPQRQGLGLRIMQYRAWLIRGQVTIQRRRPRGTEVFCTVPLPSSASKKTR